MTGDITLTLMFRKKKAEAASSFVSGTPVHTNRGLLPIEKIQIGDLVLSRSENGDTITHKPVISVSTHEDKEVWLVEYLLLRESNPRYLVATANHPFWVHGVGWTKAEDLRSEQVLEIADRRENMILSVRRALQTELGDVGYTYHDGEDKGPTIDLRNATIQVSPFGKDSYNDFAFRYALPVRRRVYNIEVEEMRTFFVGEPGVWVQSANAGKALACNEG